jgi:hypothetical protein
MHSRKDEKESNKEMNKAKNASIIIPVKGYHSCHLLTLSVLKTRYIALKPVLLPCISLACGIIGKKKPLLPSVETSS